MWGPFQTGIPDIPTHLGTGHVLWLRAAMEQGMSGMDALQCATRNIAEAYGVDSDLGTVEVGKLADFVVLDGDPMSDVDSYERVLSVTKEGRPIDIAGLPNSPVLTADRWAR
jgi:imidazolonepropionase-like amidohydrolase